MPTLVDEIFEKHGIDVRTFPQFQGVESSGTVIYVYTGLCNHEKCYLLDHYYEVECGCDGCKLERIKESLNVLHTETVNGCLRIALKLK